MFYKYFSFISSVILLSACSSPAPEISVASERDEIGNYLIKWETNPRLEGLVKIYVSDNPKEFKQSEQIIYANSSDGVTTYITKDYHTRHYFKLSFNDRHEAIVSARVVRLDSIYNFRDIGGYETNGKRKIRWGNVFRSGNIAKMSKTDSLLLTRIGIKTIIDLRDSNEITESPIQYDPAKIVHIPIEMKDSRQLLHRLELGHIRKRDALLYMQDRYLHFISDYDNELTQAIHVFLDKTNYPILIHSNNGKDRTGFLSALLLSILDIPTETIIQDYTLSSQYINLQDVIPFASKLSTEGQEAITVLLSSTKEMIYPTLQKIVKDYESLDNYFTTEMNLSINERSAIKDILLY